ncbi:hypothetical protein HPB50_025478 [Hyalomma asiaticum]|uniref:Uncharacterized protein n=1 Tax=Hyalomma asiaticum TaxID=266040 RepID=A0ACB7RVT2_HYAAI|nr:hypothetical protein HPB50_025478 [Hyalomma asiaticum]
MLRLWSSRSSRGRVIEGTPGNPICRGCGTPKPDMSHQCIPKCKLCGGEHQTGDKECKQRFQMPHIVRRRRWDRARAAAEMENDQGRSTEQSVKPQPSTAEEYPSLRCPRSTSRRRQGLGGDPGPCHAPDPDPEDRVNPQPSTSPRSRLELSAGPAQSRDLKSRARVPHNIGDPDEQQVLWTHLKAPTF